MLSSRYAWCTPERFVKLTMRQVLKFISIAHTAATTEMYMMILCYRISAQQEIPSLEDFLASTSEEDMSDPDAPPSGFTKEQDDFITDYQKKKYAVASNDGK